MNRAIHRDDEGLKMSADQRIAIFMPAFQVSATIVDILRRIPSETWDQSVEVFIHDNHSADDTYTRAVTYRDESELAKLRVNRLERNLGYGGSLKRAFTYAIEQQFHVLLELHADGQYPPERLLDLARVLLEGGYDMVQGSRVDRAAGGMPLYKLVSNSALNVLERTAFGFGLGEYHSGFRAYRCSALARIPYQACSDGHGITAELIAMYRKFGLTIGEIEVPSYYGPEVSACSFGTSVKYGVGVLSLIAESFLDRWRLYSHPRFRPVKDVREHIDEAVARRGHRG